MGLSDSGVSQLRVSSSFVSPLKLFKQKNSKGTSADFVWELWIQPTAMLISAAL